MCQAVLFRSAQSSEDQGMNLLPIFLKLAGRRCLLVGAGSVALDKLGSLLKTGVKLRVVAPEARPEVRALAREGRIEWVERAFQLSDLDGNFLVIAATDSPEVNALVYRGAVERNILCNSVDDIPNCDFFFGSVVRRGALQIAISTAGESPAFAQRLRHEIDQQLPENLGPWLEDLGQLRREILATEPRGEARRLWLHQLAERPICASENCPSRQMAFAPLAQSEAEDFHDGILEEGPGFPEAFAQEAEDEQNHSGGMVYLVGAGPGDPDLLTVKALRLIEAADVLLHDDLVPKAILDLASRSAEIVNVGKRCGAKSITQDEINALMIERAAKGRNVVRLKGGDPLVFGRAAEEIAVLTEAGVPFDIIPGVTAACAAAAAIGCSLTDRNSVSRVIISAGHHAQSHDRSSLPELEDATRVVYMPGRNLDLLAQEWLLQGLPPDLPCAVVSRAGQAGQQVQYSTLASLGGEAPTAAPSVLIAGWSVREPAGERVSLLQAELAAKSSWRL
jgi:uroporphyrin-III C-methyltransferase/precorrin-2 dehydrogenase/sirohydrochlorin ferrochelatase